MLRIKELLLLALGLSVVLCNESATQAPDVIRIFKCPSQYGYFAAPKDPRKYWMCVNFVPFVQHCPDSLLFNKDIKQCKAAGDYVLNNGHGTTHHGNKPTTHKPTTHKPTHKPTTKKSSHHDYYDY